MGAEETVEILSSASQVSDTHRCSDASSSDLPETFDLNAAGEGSECVCQKIHRVGKECNAY